MLGIGCSRFGLAVGSSGVLSTKRCAIGRLTVSPGFVVSCCDGHEQLMFISKPGFHSRQFGTSLRFSDALKVVLTALSHVEDSDSFPFFLSCIGP